MKYYPVNLDIKKRSCLVVGGGSVGTRKVRTLLECGADVTVVTAKATPALIDLADNGKITLEIRDYRPEDIENRFLVIGATDNEPLNRQIRSDADKSRMLCNIVDRPEECNFILPAIVNRGDLVIAISTSGKSPAFAKRLKKEIENTYGPEYVDFLKFMGRLRKMLLTETHDPEAHKPLFEHLIYSGLLEMVRDKRTEDIDKLLLNIIGDGFSYDKLMEN
ncbi:MAG: bifunctional precorrin-2 dehydrogenase/sirohydrochlorin ferrochelatase [Desulfobacterales bacterium]|nr:bifunctional precorrin-2 dehydrogenase/sirohydrochlorin ferrochelatase [Desulfobacterales bacterium]